MNNNTFAILTNNWNAILALLPSNWKEQVWIKGLLKRKARKFPNEESLLKTLLCYLSNSISFRSTSGLMFLGESLNVSDVAIMERLHASGPFFRWMSQQLLPLPFSEVEGYKIRIVDGTCIKPSKNGTLWRAHFSFQVPDMRCDQFILNDYKTAETFKNFTVNPGDLFIGDRIYGSRKGIRHVVEGQGDVLVRVSPNKIPLYDHNNDKIDLLAKAEKLAPGEACEHKATVQYQDLTIPVRLAIYHKTPEQAEKEIKRVKRKSSKNQHKIKPSTIDAANYIFIITTLGTDIDTQKIFDLYRIRWQVELFIKRLKSILKLEEYKKFSKDEYANAWLQGKLFLAILVEHTLEMLDSFFPSSKINNGFGLEKV
jgi:hypothetical protein